MKKIETKDKGDIGVAMVIADLTSKGVKVAIPLSEHLPFDLIAISENGKLSRVSVKFRKGEDLIEVPVRTISSNSQGCKPKQVDLNDFDAFAIYHPNTNKCYYVPSKKLEGYTGVMSLYLEKDESKTRRIFAQDFLEHNRIFGE